MYVGGVRERENSSQEVFKWGFHKTNHFLFLECVLVYKLLNSVNVYLLYVCLCMFLSEMGHVMVMGT